SRGRRRSPAAERAVPRHRRDAGLDPRERGRQPRAEGAGDRRGLHGRRRRGASARPASRAAIHGGLHPKGSVQGPDGAAARPHHHHPRRAVGSRNLWSGEPPQGQRRAATRKDVVMSDITSQVARPDRVKVGVSSASGHSYVILLSSVAAIGGFLFCFDNAVINRAPDALAAPFAAPSPPPGIPPPSRLRAPPPRAPPP